MTPHGAARWMPPSRTSPSTCPLSPAPAACCASSARPSSGVKLTCSALAPSSKLSQQRALMMSQHAMAAPATARARMVHVNAIALLRLVSSTARTASMRTSARPTLTAAPTASASTWGTSPAPPTRCATSSPDAPPDCSHLLANCRLSEPSSVYRCAMATMHACWLVR